MRHPINLTQICLLAVLAAGCGPSGPKTYPVSGTVTFNGEAVRKGHIVFSPVDGSTAPDAGEILNGEFHLQAKAGKKRAKKKPASRKKPASAAARKKSGTRAASPIVSAEEMHRMVAEAAYYRWLDRGPGGGDADSDWAWAEREVRRRLRA